MKRLIFAAFMLASWPLLAAPNPPNPPSTAYQPPATTAPVPLAISGTTARVALTALPASYPAVTIINDTTAAAFCRLGDGTVVATTSVFQLYVPAGGKWTTWDATSTNVACITAGGTGTLHITQSNGSPQLGMGGTGGGGGGAPTGPAGGDLSGIYPNPSVVSYNGGTVFGTAAALDSGTTNGTVPLIGAGNTLAPGVLPLATTGAFGAVKCDGTTITCTAGVIAAVGGGAVGANPTATIGASAVNGSAGTFMRSDAAPALPATLPALSGVNLTALNGSNIASGTVAVARGGTGINSLGTGVATALGVNTGSAGAMVLFNGAGGTPSSLTLTNATGLIASTGTTATGTPSSSTFLRGDNTWATPAGAGTVTSVAQSFTGGLISVGGSPITGAGTLALTVAGTSGGIPYFSGASTWASSGALTANLPVIGGGAGVAPGVGTVSGNTTEFMTATGAFTSGNGVKTDANHNAVDLGYVPANVGIGAVISSASTTTSPTATNFNQQFPLYTNNAATNVYNIPAAAGLSANGGGMMVGSVSANSFSLAPNGTDNLNGANSAITVPAHDLALTTSDATADYAWIGLGANLASGHLFVGAASGYAADVAASGDLTLANTGAFTLATVNSNTGACGDSTHVCQVTLNGKGLATAATAVAISGGGAVSSVSNSDGTLTISPTTGAVVGSLNLAHANTFTAEQIINIPGSGEIFKAQSGGTSYLRVDSTVGVISDTGSFYLNNNAASYVMRGGGTVLNSPSGGELDLTNGSTHIFDFTVFGILPTQATAPTVTGTGSPTITAGSTDTAGEVTGGTSATSIVVHSGDAAVTTAPFCVISPEQADSSVPFGVVTVSASHWLLTITLPALSAGKFYYHCFKNGP